MDTHQSNTCALKLFSDRTKLKQVDRISISSKAQATLNKKDRAKFRLQPVHICVYHCITITLDTALCKWTSDLRKFCYNLRVPPRCYTLMYLPVESRGTSSKTQVKTLSNRAPFITCSQSNNPDLLDWQPRPRSWKLRKISRARSCVRTKLLA